MMNDEWSIHRSSSSVHHSSFIIHHSSFIIHHSAMYNLLLSWRYLRTRYIALASIISVMLGVATMIVVNSVMAGFTTEMQNRIHGILSDLSFEARGMEGMRDAKWHMEQIDKVAGEWIEGMTPTDRKST